MSFKSEMVAEIKVAYNRKHGLWTNVHSSAGAAEIFNSVWKNDFVESFFALYLNRANNTIGYYQISSGGVAGTVCDNKLLFSIALNCLASSIILAHNHPSGNLKPSRADEALTKKVIEGARTLDLQILDHLILGEDGKFFSFADEGLM